MSKPLTGIGVLTTIAQTRAALAARRAELETALGRPATIALVPTMGALHAGHVALVKHAASLADDVVVSIFVNPSQFSNPDDLERYPRTLDADLNALSGTGAHFIFAPSADEMYPTGRTATTVSAGAVGNRFEGRSRPGHFDGVLTVVSKLINITEPDYVVFGQKDAQQVFVVRQLITDLNLRCSLEVVETVRERDGLALSSRNRFLDDEERTASRVLSKMLEAAESASDRGIDTVIAAAQSVSMGEPLVEVDYFAVVTAAGFTPVSDDYRGPAIAIVAATVGATRLIDNTPIYLA